MKDTSPNEAGHRLLSTLDLPPLQFMSPNSTNREMPIRNAKSSDLESIQDLLDDFDLPHQDLTPSHLSEFLVCHKRNEMAGVVGLERFDDVALLRSLAVRPRHRGHGMGSELTEAIERRARENGVTQIYLLTTTAADFFRRHGYDLIDRNDLPPALEETDEVAHLCPSTATCMTKKLN